MTEAIVSEGPPAELPAKANRRRRAIITGAAVAVGVGLIALLKNSDGNAAVSTLSNNSLDPIKRGAKSAGQTSIERARLDRRIPVRGHARQQAHGPGHSLRKTVQIAPHHRGPEIAA